MAITNLYRTAYIRRFSKGLSLTQASAIENIVNSQAIITLTVAEGAYERAGITTVVALNLTRNGGNLRSAMAQAQERTRELREQYLQAVRQYRQTGNLKMQGAKRKYKNANQILRAYETKVNKVNQFRKGSPLRLPASFHLIRKYLEHTKQY